MALSENLRRLQEQRGESNYRLAKDLGVTCTSVQNWRDGKSEPLAVYKRMLAEHYGCTVEELEADT